MTKSITAFIPYQGNEHTLHTIESLQRSPLIAYTYILSEGSSGIRMENCSDLTIGGLFSTRTFKQIADKTSTSYALLLTQDTLIDPGQFGIERFVGVAEHTGAGIVYSDYYVLKGESRSSQPVNDYQFGSVRDDFNFGPLVLISGSALKQAADTGGKDFTYAGWYDTRLKISQKHPLLRIPEFLYTAVETDARKSGEKMFDYVDPKNRSVHIEMEEAFTEHLRKIGAYLEPTFKEVEETDDTFPVKASVIIPVRNRIKTIRDAVDSVLKQKTNFDFNLIVVDNYSSDGTTDVLSEIAARDKRLYHIIPARTDLGIGGCWNEGIHSEHCGKYAVQLDSDDVYANESTLQTVIDTFEREKCAMVVGTYMMTDFDLQQIPPGIIDHREWTPENGRNNALRINGLGAPRAFYTPILRQVKVPNVSYGEDYAVGLAISRDYQIGRIYEPIYFCRRWSDNTDASLDIVKLNAHNAYKDKIRTIEMLARQRRNAGGGGMV
jgi:GT2 family glycosyltransferase